MRIKREYYDNYLAGRMDILGISEKKYMVQQIIDVLRVVTYNVIFSD